MRKLALICALASAGAIGIMATDEERERGRLMRGPRHPFPSWRFGPQGQSAVFESEDDVPSGWVDHPSKVKGAEDQSASGTKTAVAGANSTTTAEAAAKTASPTSQTQVDPAIAAQSGVPGLAPASSPKAAEKTAELDTDGHPFNPELHAATKSKTKAGLWRMKVGVKRPDPAPGYPLDL